MRLIDADALKKDLRDNYVYCGFSDLLNDFYHAIDEQPSADVVERKTGKWILDERPHDGDCRCSACGVAIDAMHERNHGLLNALTGGRWWTFYKFCPECGADMRWSEE